MENLDELFQLEKEITLALSYSRISDFDRNGPKALNKRTKITGQGVHIGSIVDDKLLNEKEFDNIYTVYNGTHPTATLNKLCRIILDNYVKIPTKKEVFKIIKKNKFWPKYKNDTLYATFDTANFWGYLKAMFNKKDKVLVTTPDLDLSYDLVDILKTHKNSKNIFTNSLEHHNQLKFKMEYKGFILRGILDKVLVDHKSKTVRMIDLKTGQGNLSEFPTSFIKWRYYLQEAVYTKAFKTICATLGIQGYKLLPFQFLYISRYEKIPLLFTVGTKWHNAALQGFQTKAGYNYRGLKELLDTIKWHMENRVFHMTKQVYESEGTLTLNDSFITLNNE